MTSEKKAVVLFSGGMDSATLLSHAVDQGYKVIALSVCYGQRHKVELEYAREYAKFMGVEHIVLDLTALSPLLAGSALTSEEIPVPHGHYADENMKQTVVPNRNMILMSLAAGLAVSRKAEVVFYAAHAGDHAIYPDCRPEFFEAVKQAVKLGNYDAPEIEAPFIEIRKEDIVALGDKLGVPWAMTWSCYEGNGENHCGMCGTCVERREAFQIAEVMDPTNYYKDAPAS